MVNSLLRMFEALTLSNIIIGLALSIVTFVVSICLVSIILIKIPPNYFKEDYPRDFWTDRHRGIRLIGIIGKNILGVILVALGIVMSIPGVPGQGILTILLGIILLDFPGKRGLEQKLISRPQVLRPINRLRQRFGKAELVLE